MNINVTEARERARRIGFVLRELVQKGERGLEHTRQLAAAIQADPTIWLPILRWDGVDATLAWWFHTRGLSIGDHLKAAATRAGANHEAALKQFKELQPALERAGIAVLPIKGVALLLGGHIPHPSARGIADLDCLIHESDRERAMQVLEGLGYSPESRPLKLSPDDPYAPYRDHYRHRSVDALPVDLHWRLLPPHTHGGEADDFWKHTTTSAKHGFPIPDTRPLFRHAILSGALAQTWAAFTWRAILDFIWAQGKDLGWGTHREREFQLDVAWLVGNDAVEPNPVYLAPWRAWVAAQPWSLDRQAEVLAVGIQAAMGDRGDVTEMRRRAWSLPPAERGGVIAPLRRVKNRL
ncbi:MAG: nucleotidyltransferase family protein, partial [Gemmatimonadales bacterium]